MKRRLPGEERREFQKWSSGHKQGFVYGPDADYALELALRIIKGDEEAWEVLNQRHDLLTNVAADLRSEGERWLADKVDNMKRDLNEHRYIRIQETVMRIRGSELRKIIKEELRRSMLNELSTKVLKAQVLLDDLDVKDRTGQTFEGDLLLNKLTPNTNSPGFTVVFVTKEGQTFTLSSTARVGLGDKTVPGKIVFLSKNEVEVSYTAE